MADGAEPTVKCENCEALIPESKSFLHESYCRRNVVRCKKCNKPVDKTELETHEKEAHALAPCKYCKKEFEPAALTNHSNYCDKKPRLCQFCNCDVAAEEFNNHIYSCGSRTKKCSICNKNIMIRDFDFHEQSCEFNSKNYEKSFPKPEETKVEKPLPKETTKTTTTTSYGLADKQDKPSIPKTSTTSTSTSSSTTSNTTNYQPSKPSASTGTNTTENKYSYKPSAGISTSTTSTSTKIDKSSPGLASKDIKKTNSSSSSSSITKNEKPSLVDPKKSVSNSSTGSSKPNSFASGYQEPKKKTQEELDAELARSLYEQGADDDEALARKLQDELYRGDSTNASNPRPQQTNPYPAPKDTQINDYYDDEEGNLNDDIEDPDIQNIIEQSRNVPQTSQVRPKPSSNIPSYDPFAQSDQEYQQSFGGEDAEIQKAIEESLRMGGGNKNNNFGDTMNSEDFKKALELSKKYK